MKKYSSLFRFEARSLFLLESNQIQGLDSTSAEKIRLDSRPGFFFWPESTVNLTMDLSNFGGSEKKFMWIYRDKWYSCSKILDSLMAWLGEKR